MFKKRSFHFWVRRGVKRNFIFLLALSFILAGGAPGAGAEGSILYVKPGGTGDCSSWETACTLQTALITYAVSGDQIWVAAGMYTPGPAGSDRTVTFQLKEGVAIYGGFAGTETLLSQRNWLTNVVILSGDLNGDDDGFTNNGENSYHVVKGATGANLDGVTIRGGNAKSSFPDDTGGGMYTLSGNPTLDNVTFSGNTAFSCGGMANINSSPMLTNVTFSGNTAYYEGGGMCNLSGSNPMLTNITFSGNAASGGGGMYNYDNSNTTLSNVNFISNTANSGGGMYNRSSNPTLTNVVFSSNMVSGGGGGMETWDGSPTLSNVSFSGNMAGYGGGMSASGSPSLTNVTFSGNMAAADGGGMYGGGSPMLINVIFSGNTAQKGGGGMYNTASGSPLLTNVTFSSNSAKNGGGMCNEFTSLKTKMTNITFSSNSAQNGGGMYNTDSSPTLTNATFSGNTANIGGGVYNSSSYGSSSPLVRNSILWGDSGSEIYNENGSTPIIRFSDVQGGYPGAGNIDADPLLVPLGNYGGGVQTMAFLPGSPVIDATSTYCPVSDARGLARSSPNCDLGAFESQGFTLTQTGGDNQTTLTDTDFTQPLCVTMTANYAGEPLDGAKITFTPPASGASATLNGTPATIASGAACASAVANGISGSYNVTASTAGAASVTFSLTNIPKIYLPVLLNLFR